MTGRDDDDKSPFDDSDDWVDRDDDRASGPLVDRDDEELFGAEPPSRAPAFPEERDYPDVPDWDDDNSNADSIADWRDAPARKDDLNRLAERELDALGDDPYPPEDDEPVPPMDPPRVTTAGAPQPPRDSIDGDSFEAGERRSGSHYTDWQDHSSVDSGEDSWSDDSESPDPYPQAEPGYAAPDMSMRDAPTGMMQEDSGSRRWPVAMLAIAAVAVVLLAVGGYGVISERSALEAQIRQLQSQLATAVSPEEARASRDAQQATATENTALSAEIDTLRAENRELQQAVNDMEERLQQRADEADEADAELTAARAAAEAAEAAALSSASGSSAAAGEWFVNFGSYARVADATRWAGRLEVDSGRVVVQDARSGGRTIHRVRVVGLASKSAAERVAQRLESQHNLPKLWVGKN